MPGLRRALERLRAVRHIEWALLAAAAAALLLWLSRSGGETAREASELERRMEAVLECVHGAGEVRVLVNEGESVSAFAVQDSPQVTGVIVVAEGADNLKVALELERAVQTLLGIEAGRIEVLDMKEEET